MGRAVLVARLAGRDLRRRPAQGVLLLLVMMAATTALTLGLALHGVTAQPYQSTRATRGPDVLATAFPLRTGPAADLSARSDVTRLARAPGVVQRSGPFPVAFPVLRAHGHADAVLAQGRTLTPAAVDRRSRPRAAGCGPAASWWARLRRRAPASRPATGSPWNSAAVPGRLGSAGSPRPSTTSGIGFLEGGAWWRNPGLIRVTEAAARSLATTRASASATCSISGSPTRPGGSRFANRYTAGGNASGSNVGSPYLIPLAMPSSRWDAALIRGRTGHPAGGRLAAGPAGHGGFLDDLGRRTDGVPVAPVGLLKAVGSTPALVAAVLLAEHLTVALLAAVAGVVGWLAAPAAPPVLAFSARRVPHATPATVAVVVAVALAVAIVATFVPALRACAEQPSPGPGQRGPPAAPPGPG